MQITVQAKILPDKAQVNLLNSTTKEYIRLINQIVSDYVTAEKDLKYTSKSIGAELPSAVKNQAIQDAKSVFRKYQKTKKQSILKKPVAIWNNQNYGLKDNSLSFPVLMGGKAKRIEVPILLSDYQKQLLVNKFGSLRISQKSGKYIAQIAIHVPESIAKCDQVMGVDLGLKIPAVAVTQAGKTKFFGNGRQNKFIKRKHRSVRRKLGKLKKLTALRKRANKEQRWMQDQDHKISRQIVNFAKENQVAIIRMERLTNIRNPANTSRKNEKNLHTWSFHRLAQYIKYKAILAGIKVEYVNPKHTSQKCPKCGERNKASDRKYKCGCGYKAHRDRVGALNIISATVVDGNSLSA